MPVRFRCSIWARHAQRNAPNPARLAVDGRFAGARANLVPGLIVQGVMLALLLAYWFYPPTTLLLNRLALEKEHWSYGYSAASAIIAGALIPELLRIAVFQKGRIRRTARKLAGGS